MCIIILSFKLMKTKSSEKWKRVSITSKTKKKQKTKNKKRAKRVWILIALIKKLTCSSWKDIYNLSYIYKMK